MVGFDDEIICIFVASFVNLSQMFFPATVTVTATGFARSGPCVSSYSILHRRRPCLRKNRATTSRRGDQIIRRESHIHWPTTKLCTRSMNQVYDHTYFWSMWSYVLNRPSNIFFLCMYHEAMTSINIHTLSCSLTCMHWYSSVEKNMYGPINLYEPIRYICILQLDGYVRIRTKLKHVCMHTSSKQVCTLILALLL